MRYRSKDLRSIRQCLEELRPQTPVQKWAQIIRSQRVAGVPRSVSAATKALLLSDFAADDSIDKKSRTRGRGALKAVKASAAYDEIRWLDQVQLRKYLDEFRRNGYQAPGGYKWVEVREES